MRTIVLLPTLLILFTAAPAEAQERRGERRGHVQGIPPGHLPPPGECRVWYDDRPAGHQPPPTNCEAAEREAWRTGGRVIYGGSERRDDDRGRDDRDRDDRDRDDRDRDDDRCDEVRDRDDRGRDDDCEIGEGRYPATLPDMVWGVIFGRGERVDDVRRWIGAGEARAQVTDADGNGIPEAVSWLNAQGQILQRWIDTDANGRADAVGFYRDGKLVRVIR